MMKFKKFLAATMTGAMMFGIVATAAPAVSAYAVDETSAYEIKIDYNDFTATITRSDEADQYVILEVLKDSTGTKVSGTYTFPVEEMQVQDKNADGTPKVDENGEPEMVPAYGVDKIDLSFLKATKVSYIRVHGNSESVTTEPVTVNAQPKKISVKYAAGQKDGELYKAYTINKATIKSEDLKLYEYRSLYGSEFASLENFGQRTAEIAGATIVIRKAAVTTGEEKDLAPASAEAKVKIPAAPKAPKVSIDYAKRTIKLPKNAEVQIMYTDGSWAMKEGQTLFSSDGAETDPTYTELTSGTVSDYFEYTNGAIGLKAGQKVFSDEDGNEVTGSFDTYVTYTVETVSTDWKEAGTASDQETILALFKSGEDAIAEAEVPGLVKQGFSIAVRTKASGKKTASNPAIILVKGVDEVVDGDNQITVGEGSDAATLKWTVTKTGIDYVVSGAPFEYKDGDKWKTLKVGTTTVKGAVTSNKEVEVRKAGVKSTKTAEGSFPSETTKIEIEAYVAPISTFTVGLDITELEVTADDNKVAATTIKATATIKDEDGKDVTDGIEWKVYLSTATGEEKDTPPTGFTMNNGTITIAADTVLTVGSDVYTVEVTCRGRSKTATITVKEATE